jgi:hypothetical protein
MHRRPFTTSWHARTDREPFPPPLPVAPVQDGAQVPAVVAVAFGVREQPGVPVAEVLARVLARQQQQQLLLVLGNCEHVIGAAAALCGRLLQACDDVRVLATSREPLRIAGEAAYRLAPLPVPDPDDAGGAAGAEAVWLFSDRARAVDASFALTGENRRDVARLVARLDGMPLAIELAAARVEALGVAQLLDRLDGQLALLAGGDRPATPVVLRLVECSLLIPPRPSPDGRMLMREIGFVVRGFLTVRRDSLRVPLSGSLTVNADPDSGLFSGDLALRQSTISRAVLGASLFSATVQIEAESPSSAESTARAGYSRRSRSTQSWLMSTLPDGH